MSVFAIPVAGIIFGTAMIVVLSLAGAQTRQRQAQLRADVQMKLIERFGTADDFIKFVQSDEGRRFLGDMPRVRTQFLGGIRTGIILGTLGASFAVLGIIEDRDWFIPAFILLGLGAGFFVASYFSMKVARQLETSNDRAIGS